MYISILAVWFIIVRFHNIIVENKKLVCLYNYIYIFYQKHHFFFFLLHSFKDFTEAGLKLEKWQGIIVFTAIGKSQSI